MMALRSISASVARTGSTSMSRSCISSWIASREMDGTTLGESLIEEPACAWVASGAYPSQRAARFI